MMVICFNSIQTGMYKSTDRSGGNMDDPNFSLQNRFEVKRDKFMQEAEMARLMTAGKSGGVEGLNHSRRLASLAFAAAALVLLVIGIVLYMAAYTPIEFALH